MSRQQKALSWAFFSTKVPTMAAQGLEVDPTAKRCMGVL